MNSLNQSFCNSCHLFLLKPCVSLFLSRAVSFIRKSRDSSILLSHDFFFVSRTVSLVVSRAAKVFY